MKKVLTILLTLSLGVSHAQYSIEDQLGEFAKAVPAYYFGYTKIFFENSGAPMALSNQTQHWDTRWRVKYGLGISGQAFGLDNYQVNSIDRTSLPESESIQYMGSMNNVFGSEEESMIRQYLLDANGQRVVNPLTGEFIKFDLNMPGGLSRGLGVIPYTTALFELRTWKGLSFSLGWAPIGYFLRDFEKERFKISSNMFSIGASLHLRNFFSTPFLSWFRFDGSYNQIAMNMVHIEDVMSLTSDHSFDVEFHDLSLNTTLSSLQYRGSLMIPTTKKAFIVLQAGVINSSYQFDFDYSANIEVNSKDIEDQYNIELEDLSFEIDDRYTATNSFNSQYYYSGGLFFEGAIASVYVGFAQINYPTFTLKTTVKIL